jgi:hypothetical protein
MTNLCTCGHSKEQHVNQAERGEPERPRCVAWVGMGRCVCTRYLDVEQHNADNYRLREPVPAILKEK